MADGEGRGDLEEEEEEEGERREVLPPAGDRKLDGCLLVWSLVSVVVLGNLEAREWKHNIILCKK